MLHSNVQQKCLHIFVKNEYLHETIWYDMIASLPEKCVCDNKSFCVKQNWLVTHEKKIPKCKV